MDEFFPDPGAIEWSLSGSYIDEDYFADINKILKCRIFSCEETSVKFAVNDINPKSVNKYVYLNMEYKSAGTCITMQACLKFYLIKDLASKVCVGKRHSIANDWIESRHFGAMAEMPWYG